MQPIPMIAAAYPATGRSPTQAELPPPSAIGVLVVTTLPTLLFLSLLSLKLHQRYRAVALRQRIQTLEKLWHLDYQDDNQDSRI